MTQHREIKIIIQEKGQCSKRVHGSGDWDTHQCTRKGVVVFEGRYYCQQHNPPAAAAKRDAHYQASHEKWATEARDRDEHQHRIDCYPELLAALKSLVNAHDAGVPLDRRDDRWGVAQAAIAKASPQAR